MRATDKTHRPIYMIAAMVMTVLLAVTVLLAQDNPEEVILKEKFQALVDRTAEGKAILVLLLASAEKGDALAQLILGVMAQDKNPEEVSLTEEEFQALLLASAEKGDALAQLILGVMYANGEGVPKDDAEAVRWYRLAADQGDARAQLELGLMYANERGVLKDDAEAVRWYRLAADQGNATAQFNLGSHVRQRAGRSQGRCRSRALVPARCGSG